MKNKKQILLIEDNPMDFYILRKDLEDLNVEVIWVDNLGAAVSIQDLIQFDLTLLDYEGVNPFMSKTEQLKKLKGEVWMISGAIIPQKLQVQFYIKDELVDVLKSRYGATNEK